MPCACAQPMKARLVNSGPLSSTASVLFQTIATGDSLLFEATALHGIEAIQSAPVSYMSVVFTLRE